MFGIIATWIVLCVIGGCSLFRAQGDVDVEDPFHDADEGYCQKCGYVLANGMCSLCYRELGTGD